MDEKELKENDEKENEPKIVKEKPKKGMLIFLVVAFVVLIILIIVVAVLNSLPNQSNGSCNDDSCTGIHYILSLLALLK